MLRADIDALTVDEQTGYDFASKHDGKMHACGHDAHMAILLGAAKMLKTLQDKIQGKVFLVFQPAEESGEGAKYMKQFGTWFEETDSVFGAHIWIDLPVGKISVEAGERMAAALEIGIDIEGQGGHGAQPHLTVDATVVASAIVMNLQTIVSRHFSPLDSVVLTIGKMTSGTRYNVISGAARLEGTARYFKHAIGDDLKKTMTHMVNETAAAYGAKAKVTFRQMVPPTINDPASSELAHRVGAELVGEDNVVLMEKQWPAKTLLIIWKKNRAALLSSVLPILKLMRFIPITVTSSKLMNEHCQSAPPCTHSMRCSGWKNMPNNMTK